MKTSKFRVKLSLTAQLLGTNPMEQKKYTEWVESKKPSESEEDEYDTVDKSKIRDLEKVGWTVFRKDDDGLFLPQHMIKGFLKDAANTLKGQLGIKALRSKVVKYVFVHPQRVYIGKKEPDGVYERPLRGMTPNGPIVTLVRSDYVNEDAKIEFEIEILDNKEQVNKKLVLELFEYGRLHGLGQNHANGYGTFEYEVVK